jgi:hypothetical protein
MADFTPSSEPPLSDGGIKSVRARLGEENWWLVIERGAISIACNFLDQPQMVSLNGKKILALLLSEANVEISGGNAILPPDSVAILKRE